MNQLFSENEPLYPSRGYLTFRVHAPVLMLWILSTVLLAACSKKVYLYTSFQEPATQGLNILYSKDGYHWNRFNKIFLKPEIGGKVLRDPSIAEGPDHVFHLVWTSGWKGDRGFGYASSRDLIHWSPQQHIGVMEQEPSAVNVWAPELYYDRSKKYFIIVWATTIPFQFPKGLEQEENNHRLYYVTTRDFKTFSRAAILYDPGYSSIDATIEREKKNLFVLVFKDNTRPARDIKVAFADQPTGPYKNPSASFTPPYSEGPSVLKKGKDFLIYYDWYNHHQFGAVKTRDFKTFTDITGRIDVPAGHKHGTIIQVRNKIFKHLLKASDQ